MPSKTLLLNLITNVTVLSRRMLEYCITVSLHKTQEVNETYKSRKLKLRKFTSPFSWGFFVMFCFVFVGYLFVCLFVLENPVSLSRQALSRAEWEHAFPCHPWVKAAWPLSHCMGYMSTGYIWPLSNSLSHILQQQIYSTAHILTQHASLQRKTLPVHKSI